MRMVKSIGKKKILMILSLIFVMMILLSCEKYNQYIDETHDNVTKIENNYNDKYIINIKSGKVHTYTHGINIIENKDNMIETNDSLEKILENEKYDICHTCYAGLLIDDKIDKKDIDIIEKYMRLYDFIQIEPERAEFLMSIFVVGSWYVNNVYTYQGGKDNVSTIENNAKKYASENAYGRWKNYKTTYFNRGKIENDKRILPVVYDSNNNPANLSLYECDLFKGMYAHGDTKYTKDSKKNLYTYDKECLGSGYKNDYVVDDCSKFASAVYYHYINNVILKDKGISEKDGMGIDLWTTGSYDFSIDNGKIGKILLSTRKFEIKDIKDLKSEKLSIDIGDLIYRKEKAHYENIDGKRIAVTDIPGHVEFYIGNNKFVGWGKIQNEYSTIKNLKKTEKGYISDYENDYNQPYTSIIKVKGGK